MNKYQVKLSSSNSLVNYLDKISFRTKVANELYNEIMLNSQKEPDNIEIFNFDLQWSTLIKNPFITQIHQNRNNLEKLESRKFYRDVCQYFADYLRNQKGWLKNITPMDYIIPEMNKYKNYIRNYFNLLPHYEKKLIVLESREDSKYHKYFINVNLEQNNNINNNNYHFVSQVTQQDLRLLPIQEFIKELYLVFSPIELELSQACIIEFFRTKERTNNLRNSHREFKIEFEMLYPNLKYNSYRKGIPVDINTQEYLNRIKKKDLINAIFYVYENFPNDKKLLVDKLGLIETLKTLYVKRFIKE